MHPVLIMRFFITSLLNKTGIIAKNPIKKEIID